MREYLLPTRVVDGVGIANADTLFINKGLYATINYNQDEWNQYLKIEGLGSYIILDFGKEMHGGIRMMTNWIYYGECKVRLRFGESLGEVNSSIGEKNAKNAHSPRDFETLICAYADMTLGQTGFRFVRIDLLEDKYIYFKNIFCENIILSETPIYTYQGCDERIKDIFETAKRTVDLCSSAGYIWDGIKRDRLVWAGDLAPEVMALTAIYGRLPVIENTMDMLTEIAPLPKYMNAIYTYSMWWIIILADYYKEFGCKDYAEKHLPYLTKLVEQMDELVDEKGDLCKTIRYIVDWPTKDSVDELVGVRAIFLMAMNGAETLYKAFNLPTDPIEKIRAKLNLQPLQVEGKKQVIALKYFATGELTDEDYAKLIDGRAKGFSTFMSYYVLTAIASRDEGLAIELMKEYYGAMLDRGATSFWEDFHVEWLEGSGRIDEIDDTKLDIHGDFGAHCYVGLRHSLCHGWSAGVAKFIKEHC